MDNNERLSRLKELKHMLAHHDELFASKGTKFDIAFWSDSPDIEHSCGTAACALGSACFHKPFQELGLKMEVHPHPFAWDRNIPKMNNQPSYGGYINMSAGAEFSGISTYESAFLFDPMHYDFVSGPLEKEYGAPPLESRKVTACDVAKRVAFLIERYESGK